MTGSPANFADRLIGPPISSQSTGAEASLLFGRGLRAGVDRREQKKLAAAHEAALMRRVRESQGLTETREDRQRDRNRQALAESFDQANNKVRRRAAPGLRS